MTREMATEFRGRKTRLSIEACLKTIRFMGEELSSTEMEIDTLVTGFATKGKEKALIHDRTEQSTREAGRTT